MAILKIAKMGHPVLRRPAETVGDPAAPEVRRLVEDMIETMQDAGGTGLAAPQVHVSQRILVFFVDGGRARRHAQAGAPDGEEAASQAGAAEGVPLTVLINPEMEILGEEKAEAWEACLSMPGLAGRVPRHTAVRYRGMTPEGEMIEREARGFHARVVQHEMDHLDGVLFPQRMIDPGELIFTSEMERFLEEEAASRLRRGVDV